MNLLQKLKTLLSLVRRDYAIQFAGTALGLVWLLLQYGFQIAVFYLIFGRLLGQADVAESASPLRAMRASSVAPLPYLEYLLGGMMLWLPLSDMLLKSCSILLANRSLVRRTSLGSQYFLWIPLVQAIIHYMILYLIVAVVSISRGTLSYYAPFAFFQGVIFLMFMGTWGVLLSKLSILLQDISVLMRLLLQIVFWLTPIVYIPPRSMDSIFTLHPFNIFIEIHRSLLYGQTTFFTDVTLISFASPLIFISITLLVIWISSIRLNELVMDQL